MKDRSVIFFSSVTLALVVSSVSCTITSVNGDADAGSTAGGSGTGGTSTGSAGTGGASGATGTGGTAGTGGSAAGTDAGSAADAPNDAPNVPIDGGSDPCTGLDPGNEDRDHATPYPLGAEFKGCLQTVMDVDFYEFTTPASPASGGVIVVNLTDVGTGGGVDSVAYAASDNGEIHGSFAGSGTSVFYWFGAVASTKYRVSVKSLVQGNMANPYTLKATYTGVDDAGEPNETSMQAKSIAVGAAIQGYLFAGYVTSTAPNDAAWDDWFKVTLAAGSGQVALTNLSSDITGAWSLYDTNGTMLGGTAIGSNAGSSVVSTRMGITAGDYYVKVSAFGHPTPSGNGSNLPDFALHAYTLTVTQP